KIPVIKTLLKLNIFPSNAVIGLLDRKEFLEGAGARADAVNEQAARWIERQGSQPFFLFINYMDPHDPYDPPQPFRDRFAAVVDPGAATNSSSAGARWTEPAAARARRRRRAGRRRGHVQFSHPPAGSELPAHGPRPPDRVADGSLQVRLVVHGPERLLRSPEG